MNLLDGLWIDSRLCSQFTLFAELLYELFSHGICRYMVHAAIWYVPLYDICRYMLYAAICYMPLYGICRYMVYAYTAIWYRPLYGTRIQALMWFLKCVVCKMLYVNDIYGIWYVETILSLIGCSLHPLSAL